MANLSPASCPFTIGSAVPCKNIKKTQPANLGGMPITFGTLLHKRPLIDVDPLELERRAEYDRRVAFDTRAELARREEYDRRLVYDRRNQIALCHDEEWKAQENRFTQMIFIRSLGSDVLTCITLTEVLICLLCLSLLLLAPEVS